MTSVSALVQEVLAQLSPQTRPTYRPGILRLATEFAERELDSIRLPELELLRDTVRRETGEAKVRQAKSRGRVLRGYDPDAHGKGAAENFVRATRFYFRHAVRTDLLANSPAEGLRAPRRPPAPERPLLEHELVDIWRGALATSQDGELDALLLTFLRRTACRREGTINLTVSNLDAARERVTLTEKNGECRDVPLEHALIVDLLRFAHSRGAVAPHDSVFRYRNQSPLTRRRFNSIFDRVDHFCGWTEPLDVGAHWIRHTTLADIAAVSDLRVAAAYAGHRPESLGVIGHYTKVTFEDMRDAYLRVFGADG